MRGSGPIALLVVGGCLMLGPMVSISYTRNRDRDRVAEFYSKHGNAETLPAEMRPSESPGSNSGAVCFIAGAILLLIGVKRSASGAPKLPA